MHNPVPKLRTVATRGPSTPCWRKPPAHRLEAALAERRQRPDTGNLGVGDRINAIAASQRGRCVYVPADLQHPELGKRAASGTPSSAAGIAPA